MIKWKAKPHGFSLRLSVLSVVKTDVVFVRSPAFRLGFGSARGSADYARELNIQYPMINIQ